MNPKKLIAWCFVGYFVLVLCVLFFASGGIDKDWHRKSEAYPSHLPDFSTFTEVDEKKKAFFDFLRPVVDEANTEIEQERADFLKVKQRFAKNARLSPRDLRVLTPLLKKYKIKKDQELAQQIATLDLRINTVPTALVLTQAANESAWGTSRFAVEVNNLFGQWCFSEGCGLVPADRPAGATHEVQSFDTVYAAVAAYLRNINTHRAYFRLRKLRLQLTQENKPVTAWLLAGELNKYSERGDEYVHEIRQMIRSNELE